MTETQPALTAIQQAALDIVTRDGILHCYNGVSVSTALALHNRGLAELVRYPPAEVRSATGRGRARYIRQWALKRTENP